MQGVKFAIFGLGNKQYEHFAAMGKRVNECMLQLGAQEVCPRGDGDDDEDIDEDFEKWKEQLMSKVEDQKLFGGEVSKLAGPSNGSPRPLSAFRLDYPMMSLFLGHVCFAMRD